MMATMPEPRPLLRGPPPSDDSASRRVSLRRFLKAFKACFSVSLVISSDMTATPGVVSPRLTFAPLLYVPHPALRRSPKPAHPARCPPGDACNESVRIPLEGFLTVRHGTNRSHRGPPPRLRPDSRSSGHDARPSSSRPDRRRGA